MPLQTLIGNLERGDHAIDEPVVPLVPRSLVSIAVKKYPLFGNGEPSASRVRMRLHRGARHGDLRRIEIHLVNVDDELPGHAIEIRRGNRLFGSGVTGMQPCLPLAVQPFAAADPEVKFPGQHLRLRGAAPTGFALGSRERCVDPLRWCGYDTRDEERAVLSAVLGHGISSAVGAVAQRSAAPRPLAGCAASA